MGAGRGAHPAHSVNSPHGLDPKDPVRQTRLSHPRGGACPGSSDHLSEVELGCQRPVPVPGLGLGAARLAGPALPLPTKPACPAQPSLL